MLVLGLESSCDETGVALYDTQRGLLVHRLHTQMAMHAEYGGVVPELASRDHIRRILPLTQACLDEADVTLRELDGIAFTEGPGLSGALLVAAAVANGLGVALGKPVIGVHHLEGHLLSPLLADPAPAFPFVALLVSGGHTQLMAVHGVGRYTMLGETLDDAAGEAFDKTAKLLGLGYPGGPALSKLADTGDATRFTLPRPMLNSGDLDFSFAGLKTAVLTLCQKLGGALDDRARADVCAAFQAAMVEVLTKKCRAALKASGLNTLVVAGGVGANRQLRAALDALAVRHRFRVFYPPLELCTDNGAMIAFAGAQRLAAARAAGPFRVQPRWALESLPPAA
jgi:N6-L-threonylcarbamoyladenine synthase